MNEELNKLFLVIIHFQRKLYSTEYNVDPKIWSEDIQNTHYFESLRGLESQRLQLLEANQWADQAQQERILLCSELKMKNRHHQERYARSCQ